MRGQAQARCHLVILCPAEPRGQLYCVSRLSGATCSTLWPPTPNSPAAKHKGSECGFWSCAPGNRLPVTKYLLCDLRGLLGNVKYQDAVRHSSGAVLRVVRMSGGWQGRTAWGGDGVGGPAHPPGCCQKWAGMRELAYSVFTILTGHVDPPWRLCFAGEQQPSQSPKDWLATTPSFWGLAHLWSRWLQGAGCQGPRSPCFGPQTLQLRRSLTSCVMT